MVSIGFERHMQCSHCTEALRLLCVDARLWGRSMYLSAQDVLTAFDIMRHDVLHWALLRLVFTLSMSGLYLKSSTTYRVRCLFPQSGLAFPSLFAKVAGKEG